MIRKYNRISLVVGIPGLLVQLAGFMTEQPFLKVVGTLLLLVGLAYYAKAKGRNPAWCLMALLSIVGLLVLAILKDLANGDVAA